jgi:hypothetical protein
VLEVCTNFFLVLWIPVVSFLNTNGYISYNINTMLNIIIKENLIPTLNSLNQTSRVSLGTFFQLGYGCSKLLVNISTIAWTGSIDGRNLFVTLGRQVTKVSFVVVPVSLEHPG